MRDYTENTLQLLFTSVLALPFITSWQPLAFATYCTAMNQAMWTVKNTNNHNENNSFLN